MKPIGNIFGFDCITCEHNRNCYGGNIGNQFRYCQKSIEKVQNLDKLEQENQELKKQLEEVEFIVGLRQKRNLISKFDKEYDEEDKKKNPNRDYTGIMPDAEEVYRRYYIMKNQQKEFIEYLENKIKRLEKSNNEFDRYEKLSLKEILSKYKEKIRGGINE